MPTLSSTPTSSTPAPIGASAPASGSQVWSGTSGALIANATKKPRNSQHLRALGDQRDDRAQRRPVERAARGQVLRAHHVQPDHDGQHDQAADQGVQEELHRGVLPARAAEAPDEEVHRDRAWPRRTRRTGRRRWRRRRRSACLEWPAAARSSPDARAALGQLLLPGEQHQPGHEERRSARASPARCRRSPSANRRRTPGSTRARLELEAGARLGGRYRVGDHVTAASTICSSAEPSATCLATRGLLPQRVHRPGRRRSGNTQQDGKQEVHANTHREESADDEDGAAEHAQRVRADEAGLQPAQPARSRRRAPPPVPLTSPSTPRLSK